LTKVIYTSIITLDVPGLNTYIPHLLDPT